MSQTELVNEFKEGLSALRKGLPQFAILHLRKALENDKANPFYLSYYGLALARMGQKLPEAEDFCVAALKIKRTEAHLYLNLAEVYRRVGQREYALFTLHNGLQYTQWDTRLLRALETLGVRRRPVLPFLQREHFLNRHLGRLRNLLVGHGGPSALETLRVARS